MWRPILTMSRPRFKTTRTEDPGQDPPWQDVESSGSWLHLWPVPHKRDPHDKSLPRTTSLCLARQVSTSHDKSPPRTTRTHLARQVSASRDHSPPRTTTLRLWLVRGPWRMAWAPPPTRVGERFPMPCKYNSWRPCKQLTPTRALMLAWPTMWPSHRHHLPLCHAQAQPEALEYPLRRARA
jgi:hypothetical protein